jgi:hypothetical protein
MTSIRMHSLGLEIDRASSHCIYSLFICLIMVQTVMLLIFLDAVFSVIFSQLHLIITGNFF